MTDIVVVGRIDRPAGEVFTFVCDMAQNPTWQKGQVSCVWTSEPPIAVGSTYDQHARFAGRDIHSSFVVTEFEQGRTIRIASVDGPMPIDVTRTVVAIGDSGCEVTAHVRGEPPGLLRLLGPITDWMVRRSVRGDYRRLKAHLEDGPTRAEG